jgi:diguanylate cyclase (GGDEF)-like protein
MGSKVLWLGPREQMQTLVSAGIDVVPAEGLVTVPGDIGVVVVSGDPIDRRILAQVPDGVRVIALVAERGQVLSALSAGADDALDMSDEGQLTVRLLRASQSASRERERLRALELRLAEAERRNTELRELAHLDVLTGLGNRRSFSAALEHSIEYAARYNGVVGLMLSDLDGLKPLNDTFGHPAGDAALRAVAEVFRASVRSIDHVARIGGDELAVVMPATRPLDAAHVAERIRARIAGLRLPLKLTASFGVAAVERPRGVGFAADELIARADAALYEAKRGGKDRVCLDGGFEPARAAV